MWQWCLLYCYIYIPQNIKSGLWTKSCRCSQRLLLRQTFSTPDSHQILKLHIVKGCKNLNITKNTENMTSVSSVVVTTLPMEDLGAVIQIIVESLVLTLTEQVVQVSSSRWSQLPACPDGDTRSPGKKKDASLLHLRAALCSDCNNTSLH